MEGDLAKRRSMTHTQESCLRNGIRTAGKRRPRGQRLFMLSGKTTASSLNHCSGCITGNSELSPCEIAGRPTLHASPKRRVVIPKRAPWGPIADGAGERGICVCFLFPPAETSWMPTIRPERLFAHLANVNAPCGVGFTAMWARLTISAEIGNYSNRILRGIHAELLSQLVTLPSLKWTLDDPYSNVLYENPVGVP